MKTEDRPDPFEILIEHETDCLALSFIVAAEVLKKDGTKALYLSARREQSATVTLGLLHSVAAIESLRLARNFNNPE